MFYLMKSSLNLGCYKKYHRFGDLNHRHLFLTIMEAGKSKIKELTNSIPVKAYFLVYRWPFLIVCSHTAAGERVGRMGELGILQSFLLMMLIPS